PGARPAARAAGGVPRALRPGQVRAEPARPHGDGEPARERGALRRRRAPARRDRDRRIADHLNPGGGSGGLSVRFADPAFLRLLAGLLPLALLRGRRAPIAAVLFPSAEIARAAARSVRPARAGGARLWIRFAALSCLAIALARPQLAESTADVE